MILGLICARKGSKRLPNKNLRKINNKTLLSHTIEHAKDTNIIDKIILSTDCPIIAEEGQICGAEVPFIRPEALAKDDTPEWKVWQHALNFLKLEKIGILVILPTTAPLRNKDDIISAINIFKSNTCDGVLSVTNSHRNPTFNIVKENKNKFAQIAIQSSTNLFRSQDAENFFDVTTVCYVMNPKFVLNNNNMFEGNLKLNHVPKERSIDIDTEFDLLLANLLFNHYNNIH